MDSNSMESLFTGLIKTGKDIRDNGEEKRKDADNINHERRTYVVSGERKKQKKHEKDNNVERFCSIVDIEIMKKIRIIATREGLQIKDVVEAAFQKAINNYERKHGKIEEKASKKAIDLF